MTSDRLLDLSNAQWVWRHDIILWCQMTSWQHTVMSQGITSEAQHATLEWVMIVWFTNSQERVPARTRSSRNSSRRHVPSRVTTIGDTSRARCFIIISIMKCHCWVSRYKLYIWTICREAEEAQKCINDYGSTCPQIVKDYFFKRSVEDGMNNGGGFEDYLRSMNQGYCRIIDEEDSEDGPNCML